MKLCLICDDHAIMREALAATISRVWPDADIIDAGDFPSAWAQAEKRPDLCLCDLSMPGSEPLEGIAELRRVQPDMPIIIISGSASDEEMMALLKSGVHGFIAKSSSGPVIEAAIRLVLAGGTYLPPRLTELMEHMPPAPSAGSAPALTRRQRQVLGKLAKGYSNKEIAGALGIAPSTVKFHVDSLLERLDAKNRAEAVSKARALDFS